MIELGLAESHTLQSLIASLGRVGVDQVLSRALLVNETYTLA